uniref:Putative O-methyltransferase n=1 Tax=Epimedium sagittatum TaxID=253616 RepID=A0A6N0C876_9MAGN|nr:putative O-methyltransferase [Epimedium sagittatum]
MGSVQNQFQLTNQEEEDGLYGIQLLTSSLMPKVMEAAIELDVFQIIARAGEEAQLSPREIASKFATQNPEAPIMLDRLLRLLASYSVLNCSIKTDDNGHVESFYGLKSICKYFLPNEDGVSFIPWLSMFQYKTTQDFLPDTSDAVLHGGMAFNRVHGMNMFQYLGKDHKLADIFNKMMYVHTKIVMKKILAIYKGFEEVKQVVDIGGGLGNMSKIITSKYPTIKCINFDLPGVVETAPPLERVEHVGGDMFASVPRGDTIFLKSVLHNWDDERCLKLLKNCYEALPNGGKVIAVDLVVPPVPEPTAAAKGMYQLDIVMMLVSSGGKERTEKEFESLAKEAGFFSIILVCSAYNYWAMEFCKTEMN